MMELIKDWILGITSASVLLSIAKALIPKGAVKQVGELACGLILLMAIAAPLAELDIGELSLALTEYRMSGEGSAGLLKIENTELIKEIIEEKTAAYISDKATELGMHCSAEIAYEYSETGLVYPVAVSLRGTWTESQRAQLTAFIESELAVPKDKQTYEKENMP